MTPADPSSITEAQPSTSAATATEATEAGSTEQAPRVLTGAEIICECLLREGVDIVFGYPGGAILPTYDAFNLYPNLHHVLTRHEQGATHMADGYARATGKVGVAIATSGPGATNMITGLATAMLDSSPVVAITGQVGTALIGSDAFQETDVTGISLPITKHNYLVTHIDELAHTIKEAFHIARTGRPGPVLIDIPKDVQVAKTEYIWPEEEIRLPGYRAPRPAPEHQIDSALELIKTAERPVILAGQGVLLSDASRDLKQFAEQAQIPIALTLLGKSGIDENHPLCLGMMGMHGGAHVNKAIQKADLLLAFGMRFDDRVTGNLQTYAKRARKIHVDIDASEINKNVRVDVGIVGDLGTVLRQMLPRLERSGTAEWTERIRTWKADGERREFVREPGEDPDMPGFDSENLIAGQVIYDLHRATKGDAITVTDVGQHQMWEAQYYHHHRPRTLITSGGLGTMGFGLPAAIGAKMSKPEEEVWAVVGDGGFQMTMMELATAVQERVNVKVAVINNGFLGMVRQWQEFFYDERYYATPMINPDFCKIAEAYGIPTRRVTKREEVADTLQWAEAIDEGPVLVEFVVTKEDIVYPMVPAGADLDDMIRRPTHEELDEQKKTGRRIAEPAPNA